MKFTNVLIALLQNVDKANEAANNSDWSATLRMLGQFCILVIVFVFIIFLAYYTTKLLSGGTKLARRSGNLRVIEAVGVGFQNTVQLVRAGDKYFLVGVSKTAVSLIAEVDADSLSLEEKNTANIVVPFEKYLNKYFKKNAKDADDLEDKKAEVKGNNNE